ncbi:MAG: helix-turn-helix domain-containing protein [Blautia sp.]
MNIAYRFRIYPTEEQKILLSKTFGCCRFLYNQMLNDKIQEYEKTKKMLKNTPAMYKKEYPFLKEVDSLALANVQLHLEKAYKNFFRNRRLDFQGSSQSIILETAIQRMWSMEIFWWKVSESVFLS